VADVKPLPLTSKRTLDSPWLKCVALGSWKGFWAVHHHETSFCLLLA